MLILSEITDLEEAASLANRVHEEEGWLEKLDRDSAHMIAITIVEVDVLDVRKGILDLVSFLIVVDVVGHRALVGGVKDDEIHSVLGHAHPLANSERLAVEMVNHCSVLASPSLLHAPLDN